MPEEPIVTASEVYEYHNNETESENTVLAVKNSAAFALKHQRVCASGGAGVIGYLFF